MTPVAAAARRPAPSDPRVRDRLAAARATIGALLARATADPSESNRIAQRFIRRLERGPALEDGETLLDGLVRVFAGIAGLERAAVRRGLQESLASLAGTVLPHYASALVQVELEGRKVKDFADHAGISVSNGGVRLHRARRAVRRRFRTALAFCDRHQSHVCLCRPAES